MARPAVRRLSGRAVAVCVLLAAVVVAITGGAVVAGTRRPGYPFATSVSKNHRYLVDQYGHPYLIVGDSAHTLSVYESTSEMNAYFADRQAHGFNAVLVQLIVGPYIDSNNVANFGQLRHL